MSDPSPYGTNSGAVAAPLQIEHVRVDSLRPDLANPRRISDAELEALTRSIQQFGLVDPVIARRDGTVIAGTSGSSLPGSSA